MIYFLKKLCLKSIIKQIPTLYNQISIEDIDITETKNKHAHFQFNSAMSIGKKYNIPPVNIAEHIKYYINKNKKLLFKNINITNPGFINFKLHAKFINKIINFILLKNKQKKTFQTKNIIIDYSSPNIAKEMHIGHLRSTIIGDCIANILEYTGHKIFRVNHLGDWGTQFGILIHYLNYNSNITKIKLKLNYLSECYKKAQILFNNNKSFKQLAKQEVIKLQAENKISIKIWKKINNVSQKEYNKIYKLLNIKLTTKGESFYKNILDSIINKLKEKQLVTTSNNAQCIYLKGFNNKQNKPLPLIIKKTDGGFNYATTDLAALYYRIKHQKADHIIYITDSGQKTHFEMLFEVAKKSNFITKTTKLTHIPIGLMLNNKGKRIKTRSGLSEKLIDVLNLTIKKTKKTLLTKDLKLHTKNLNLHAKIMGINTIKYADLSNNIKQNYKFDHDNMLKFNGNTAMFLIYAYVRIISIKEKAGYYNYTKKNIQLIDPMEIELGLHIIQYDYIIKTTANELNPNILTLYLYNLAVKFHSFFHKCNVINSKYKHSRIQLCELIGKIMKQGLLLLGLKPINKI